MMRVTKIVCDGCNVSDDEAGIASDIEVEGPGYNGTVDLCSNCVDAWKLAANPKNWIGLKILPLIAPVRGIKDVR